MSDIKEGLWLNYIKRLHSLAESGLAFSPEEFDKERYEEISEICRTMMSELAVTPVQTINDLVTPFHQRYVTPQVEVRGAIFKDNKILLVQEKSDSKWTMPGGYADVGLTAVKNIQKEISEEATLTVTHCELVSVRHKASGDYKPDLRDFYKLIFLCQCNENQKPKAGSETKDARYFELDQLPTLSEGRTIPRDIVDAYDLLNGKLKQTIIE